MKYFNLKKNNSGFTLVEMMVAIAVFSIVMVTAMSALLNVIDANNKARAIKTAINNISFALEGISKDMRMGTEYDCIGGNGLGTECSPQGNIGISFKSSKTIDGVSNPYISYVYRDNKIQSCVGTDCTDFSDVTSSEVKLTNVKFYILNVNVSGKQPRMLMTVNGEAGTKERIKTTFDLQTGVSQINRPE
jgi:prepilin-type N-terminal cleavage/methylation domain-containing protein